jgi:hypothetical protein
MASKFLIKIVPNERTLKPDFRWQLESIDGHTLCLSLGTFETESAARSNIAEVKKAANKYAKVEVEK